MKGSPQLPLRVTPGYTLIEVMAVLVIIGLLSALVLTAGGRSSHDEKNARAKAELAVLSVALAEFRRSHGDYPRVDADPTQEGATAGRALYAALTGWRGAAAGGAPFTVGQKTFINAKDYKLSSALTASDGGNNYLLDPWGHAYRYYYSTDSGWKKPAYVLFSDGQDGALSLPLPADGLTGADYAAVAISGRLINADNLYAGDN